MSTPADPPAAELIERFRLKALVESCLVLEDGISTAREIDLGMMAGAGITPPPLAAADQAGLDEVLARLDAARARWGEDFAAPAILRRLVAQGRLGVATGQGFFPYPRPDAGWAQRPVKLETREDVAIAWLDRPPANSLSPDMLAAIEELWREVSAGGVRVLVFASANPQLFCAGADIKAFSAMARDDVQQLADAAHGLFSEMGASAIVTIAAVNAAALGGGCELAMACDLRLAAESASFGQPEINLGIIPGFGGTQRLPRLIGAARALELNLSGDPIGAIEAYEIGLVNRVVADHELLDTALAFARKLAGQAPLAVGHIKRVAADGDLARGLAAERSAFVEVFETDDAREGIGAFLGKRSPRWTGR
jgi:enoyl-CoA hydratase/3-hydroxyacyl-CoA dehydrogenase